MPNASNLGIEYDLEIVQGATLVLNVVCTDPTTTPPAALNVSAFSFRAQIRKVGLAPESLVDFDCEVTDGINGKVTLTAQAADTARLTAGESVDDDASQYVWDLQATDASGNMSYPAWGAVSVFRAVTR